MQVTRLVISVLLIVRDCTYGMFYYILHVVMDLDSVRRPSTSYNSPSAFSCVTRIELLCFDGPEGDQPATIERRVLAKLCGAYSSPHTGGGEAYLGLH